MSQAFPLKDSYPDIDTVIGELGQPMAEFQAAKGTIVGWMLVYGLGVVAGLGSIAGAIYYVATYGTNLPTFGAAKNEPSWSKVGFLLLVGTSAGLLCAALFRLKVRDLSNRVLVYPSGFINARKKIEVYRWDDIDKVMQDPVDGQSLGQEGPPMKRGTTFLVKRKDGGEFGFGLDSLQNHKQLARLLYGEARARGICWEFYTGQ